MKRQTIDKKAELSGIAIHSGENSKVRFLPAEKNTGIVFVRTDLKGSPIIKALPENVSNTTRGTTLSFNNVNASVVEHILSALYVRGISDIIIELSNEEPPVMDGSALCFLKAIKHAGIKQFNEDINEIRISEIITVEEGSSTLKVTPSDRFKISFMINFPGTPIKRQELSLEITPESFEREIAPARTFGFMKELDVLKSKGLALGASEENALAVGDSDYINQPRYPDEAVRHKILDLIGDLALLGRPLRAHVHACLSSHKLNTKLALLIKNKADISGGKNGKQ